MIDIHCHLLPGVDDGPRDQEEAGSMVELAAADGITHMVATPHCNSRYRFSFKRNRALLAELVAATDGRMSLSCGCDFRLNYENLARLQTDPSLYTINQGNYLLLEFPEYGIAPRVAQEVHQLHLRGLVPIITHPERSRVLVTREFRFLRQLIEMGCPVQVTAGSLTGSFGRRAQEATNRLFDAQMVHLVASDAHGTERRPPRLSEAHAIVAKRWGEDVAQAVFVDNPGAVIAAKPLPYFSLPVEVARKKRFLFF